MTTFPSTLGVVPDDASRPPIESPATPISTTTAPTGSVVAVEDRWSAPRWMSLPVLTLLWLAAVVYGCLVPFDMEVESFVAEHGGWGPAVVAWLGSPAMQWGGMGVSAGGVPEWVSDLVVNSLLYVPLGAMMMLCLGWRGVGLAGLVWRWDAVAVGLIALAWLLEATQGLSPSRVASALDVFTNAVPGMLAAALVIPVGRAGAKLIFHLYVRWAGTLHTLWEWVKKLRGNRWVVLGVSLLNLLGIAAWLGVTVAMTGGGGGGGKASAQWMPFESQFHHAYDSAALMLGQGLLLYCLVSAVVALLLMRQTMRKTARWVVLGVALGALAVELAKLVGGIGSMDVTWPIVAAAGAGLVFVSAYLLMHGVRMNCRRRVQVEVDTDRRRKAHDYSFALHRTPMYSAADASTQP